MSAIPKFICLRQLLIHPAPWRSVICCLPFFWATPSSAQQFDGSDAMYAGVSYGRLLANQMSQGTINQALQQQGLAVTTLSAEDRSAGGKAFAGYRLHPNWAVELAYTDLGSYHFNGQVIADPGSVQAKFKANDWHLGLLGIAPLNDSLSVFGKAGMGYWRTDLQASGTFSAQGAQRVKGHGSSPVFGIGTLGLQFNY